MFIDTAPKGTMGGGPPNTGGNFAGLPQPLVPRQAEETKANLTGQFGGTKTGLGGTGQFGDLLNF